MRATLNTITKTLIGLCLLCSAGPILFLAATGAGWAATTPWLEQAAVELTYLAVMLAVLAAAVALFKTWKLRKSGQ